MECTTMSVAKVTEIIASSTKSFDDAVTSGIKRASKTLKQIRGAWVRDHEVVVDGAGKITEYRVKMKVTFVLED
jgi:dodecin